MNLRWIGAIFVVYGCGRVGFQMAARYKREEHLLRKLRILLEYMECQLQYSLVSLPELCFGGGKMAGGSLQKVFLALAGQLEQQLLPDVKSCMRLVLEQYPDLPQSIRKILLQMGETLGAFDLPGQIKQLQSLQLLCQREGRRLETNRDDRIHSYQTLGLCTGLALAILLI